MSVIKDVMIVGAGPFGLSIAAHLRGYKLDFCIVGRPMENWLSKMPKGMLLKSPGFSSNLCDPGKAFALRDFCEARGLPYEDLDFPISVETFCAYGMAFQDRFVPDLKQDDLVALTTCPGGFELRMASGKVSKSRKVIIATGIDYFRHVPAPLAALSKHLVSHSADHHDLQRFKGREVAVLGSGASAIDLAVLLQEAGASVHHVARKPGLDFGTPWRGSSRPLWRRMREPISGIGPGWRSRLCTDMPWLYRHFPDGFRLHMAKTHLGPAGGWFMRERAAGVPVLAGMRVTGAQEKNGRAQLNLGDSAGTEMDLIVEHIIAATGYENDVHRLPFLPPDLVGQMDLVGKTPRLSAQFESSIPGLYFAGPIAAASFGPVMRFVAGAGFTSRRISAHLARSFRARRNSAQRNSWLAKSS